MLLPQQAVAFIPSTVYYNIEVSVILAYVTLFLSRGHSTCICSAQSENHDNSGIALRKVRIPKLADRVRILTLHSTIRNCPCAKWESGQSENRIFVICFAGKIDMEQRFTNFYKSSIAYSHWRVRLSLISWDEGGVNCIMTGGQGTNSNFTVFWVLRCQNRRGNH